MSAARFLSEPDPENPGWHTWALSDSTRFNSVLGKMILRLDPDGQARIRMFPAHIHSNLSNNVHGGTTLAFIDVSLFAASRLFGLIDPGTSVTLDLSTHFIGAGKVDEPLDAVVELLRETGRLLFLRGLIVQGDHTVASFAGTIRKPGKAA
ncbi:PaaI family thioesterase [Sphingobium boeckii]|uniref:Acyl-coenzyme A thioesterase PaaI-like protein n=1 Tax=Sphingobium boeckii TaxID=1082345 RepID=A0A7W9EEM2_9SPHN|nr:PaaI family thioesterase [Sphingobium boeckii]MBB5686179.1 acyl-coenzyme A thioesterase PaaI-like protein [Sphingobium boeckii]